MAVSSVFLSVCRVVALNVHQAEQLSPSMKVIRKAFPFVYEYTTYSIQFGGLLLQDEKTIICRLLLTDCHKAFHLHFYDCASS